MGGEVEQERVTEATMITVYYIYDKCNSEAHCIINRCEEKKKHCLQKVVKLNLLFALVEDSHREIKCLRPKYLGQTFQQIPPEKGV